MSGPDIDEPMLPSDQLSGANGAEQHPASQAGQILHFQGFVRIGCAAI
jgi:hypothetical protein